MVWYQFWYAIKADGPGGSYVTTLSRAEPWIINRGRLTRPRGAEIFAKESQESEREGSEEGSCTSQATREEGLGLT